MAKKCKSGGRHTPFFSTTKSKGKSSVRKGVASTPKKKSTPTKSSGYGKKSKLGF